MDKGGACFCRYTKAESDTSGTEQIYVHLMSRFPIRIMQNTQIYGNNRWAQGQQIKLTSANYFSLDERVNKLRLGRNFDQAVDRYLHVV